MNQKLFRITVVKKIECTKYDDSDDSEIENNNAQRTILPNVIWTTEKCDPKIHNFTVRNSSTQAGINYSWKIINYFQSFVKEEMVGKVVLKRQTISAAPPKKQKNNNNVKADTVLN